MCHLCLPRVVQNFIARSNKTKPRLKVRADLQSWAKCLLALDVINLSPEVIVDTLGAVLKYQDDIQKLQCSEAKRILDAARADLTA